MFWSGFDLGYDITAFLGLLFKGGFKVERGKEKGFRSNNNMTMQGPVELLHKVLVIGEGGTGKTCLIRRYVHSIFQASNKTTIGVDFALKVITQKNRNITLQIWDIAGQERYGQMTRVYYQAAVGAMVVCDITRPETFDAAIKWKQDLDSKVFLGNTGKPIPCILLANKCDMGKLHMTNEEMDAFCREHGFIGWYETSAKEDKNVTTAFLALVEHVLTATSDQSAVEASKPQGVVPRTKPQPQKKKCC